jgi:hypothetical protein
MHYERTGWDKYSLHPSFNCFLFHTDTNCTLPHTESNWRCRGTTSEWCVTSEQGETNILFILHSTVSYFIQTLTTLNLRENKIGDAGAQHLSGALLENKVRQILSSSFIQLFLISLQTLTTLSLRENKIGDKGAQHLSDALLENRVRQIFSWSFIQLFLISYRHSLHSTFTAIKSEIKGQNISLNWRK